jgi:hypothetical protein
MQDKDKDKGKKYNRICLFLTEEETQKLYEVMYKERLMPAKILRKALMEYIDRALSEEEKEPVVF